MFMITNENLLHFLEYFDDKRICMKNFPLGFVMVRSTHLSFGFIAQNNVRQQALLAVTLLLLPRPQHLCACSTLNIVCSRV